MALVLTTRPSAWLREICSLRSPSASTTRNSWPLPSVSGVTTPAPQEVGESTEQAGVKGWRIVQEASARWGLGHLVWPLCPLSLRLPRGLMARDAEHFLFLPRGVGPLPDRKVSGRPCDGPRVPHVLRSGDCGRGRGLRLAFHLSAA